MGTLHPMECGDLQKTADEAAAAVVQTPRILLFSERNIYRREVWRCAFSEFEGLLQDFDAVDVVAPGPKWSHPLSKRIAARLGRRFRTPVNPGIHKTVLDRDYDVFFAICEKPSELLNVNSVRGWKDRCKTSFCWVAEFWARDMASHRSCLEVLSQFDFVLSFHSVLDPFRQFAKGQCLYLPGATDALRFCPYPNPPKRSIDVLSIGRRSEKTHQALLRSAARDGFFYVYDTFSDLAAYDLTEHRVLMSNMAKRSRYFLANPAKIDVPEERDQTSEFGNRHFEGAAAGALVVGERPGSTEFDRIFHWKDALIEAPFGAENIADIMRELDRQPDRQIAARRNNIVQTLLHHDWSHRWEYVLNLAQVAPSPRLLKRKRKLKELADFVAQAPIEP